jgi:tRNA1Val (adenine37-N6)-methyltransferase
MGGNKWFEFKQFRIEQNKASMKVGTDGVILGAWVSAGDTERILDVGTGTGLIAMMIAQRCNARIDAVEIDEGSFSDAAYNFSHSTWKERLKVFHSDFNTFSNGGAQPYDLIVCNPPYFVDSFKTTDSRLAKARHNVSIDFVQLIQGSVRLLNAKGRLAVIIPSQSFDEFRETARLHGFYLQRLTTVFTKAGNPAVRVMLEFSVLPCYPQTDEIYLRNRDGQISDRFKELTISYYLNI